MMRPLGSGQVNGPQSATLITLLTTAEQPIYHRVTTEPINLLAHTATARKLDAEGEDVMWCFLKEILFDFH